MWSLRFFTVVVVCVVVSPSFAAYPNNQESSYQYHHHQYEIPTTQVLPNLPHSSINIRRLGDDSVDSIDSIDSIPLQLPLASAVESFPALETFPAQERVQFDQRYRLPPFAPPYNGPPHHFGGYPPFKGEGYGGGRPTGPYHRGPDGFKPPRLDLDSMSSEEVEALLSQSLLNVNEAIANVQPKDFWINSGKIGAILRYKKRAAEKVESEAHSSTGESMIAPPVASRRRLQYGNNFGYDRQRSGNAYPTPNNRYGGGYNRSPYDGNRNNNNNYNNNNNNNGLFGRRNGRNPCCHECRQGDVQCLTYCERIC